MKKSFVLSVLVFLLTLGIFSLIIFLAGCKNTPTLFDNVIEYRQNIFEGSNETYHIKGYYGFRKSITASGESIKENALTLKLLDLPVSEKTYTAKIEFNGNKYSEDFTLSAIANSLYATFKIDDFNLNEFNVCILVGSNSENVTLKSIVPLNTISGEEALNKLTETQGELLKHYSNQDGIFNGEIIERLIVKDGKAFWYIGIKNNDEKLKALLMDGKTGEVLAVRDIFK